MLKAQFAEGWLRLTKAHGTFVTDELTQVYWEVLQQLTPDQWAHAVTVSLEASEDKKLPTTGALLARGRNRIVAERTLPEPRTDAWDRGHPECPRRPGESAVAYVDRLAKRLGMMRAGAAVQDMPDARLPYKEPEEVDRGDDADNY